MFTSIVIMYLCLYMTKKNNKIIINIQKQEIHAKMYRNKNME